MAVEERSPNPIDIHVGSRVRLRRKFLGLSQGDIAAALDLTFQQVQKYERGANRISASKLYETARALKVPVAYFFEGFEPGEGVEGFDKSTSEETVSAFLLTNEGLELAEAFPRITSVKRRRKIMDLVRALADEDLPSPNILTA